MDLDAFFDAWVFTPGYSVFVVRERTVNAVNDLRGGVEHQPEVRGTTVYHEAVPLEVSFLNAEGEEFLADIVASGANALHTVMVPFEPALVVLNGTTG